MAHGFVSTGVIFPDASIQTTALTASLTRGTLRRVTTYLTAGAGTWTRPADVTSIYVVAVGGGGGGTGDGQPGAAGGNTTIAGITAVGGKNDASAVVGVISTGAQINRVSRSMNSSLSDVLNRSGVGVLGSGGGGYNLVGMAGSTGESYIATAESSYAYTVGAGGAGGAFGSYYSGFAGGAGAIIIWEYA